MATDGVRRPGNGGGGATFGQGIWTMLVPREASLRTVVLERPLLGKCFPVDCRIA